jgi:hypothetical protein
LCLLRRQGGPAVAGAPSGVDAADAGFVVGTVLLRRDWPPFQEGNQIGHGLRADGRFVAFGHEGDG